MLACYIMVLGTVLVLAGVIEVILPLRAFSFWKRWSSSKFFFLHGILMIAAGFPLTLYAGPLSAVIFAMGLLAVLTGPFVLIYPEKIRMMFGAVAGAMKEADIKKMVYVEGFLRIAAGAVCAVVFFLNLH